MASQVYRALMFVLYQFSIAVGITLLPVALVANRAGVPFPIGRLIEHIGDAYDRTEPAA
jgi:hypothetical protein